jgi:hypothetical protein
MRGRFYVAPAGAAPPITGTKIGTPDDPWTEVGDGELDLMAVPAIRAYVEEGVVPEIEWRASP